MDTLFIALAALGAGMIIGVAGIGIGELLYRWDRRRGRV